MDDDDEMDGENADGEEGGETLITEASTPVSSSDASTDASGDTETSE